MRSPARHWAMVALVAMLAACASEPGDDISPFMNKLGTNKLVPPPRPDESVVIFIRPTDDRAGTQSTLYDLRSDGDHFVGVGSAYSRVAWRTEPGSHLFMVIGEAADFMYGQLAPGKTYYVQIVPRFGFTKARFSLYPVRRQELGSAEFDQWNALELVECNEKCERWVRKHVNSIVSKRAQYLAKWNEKGQREREAAGLQPDDGW